MALTVREVSDDELDISAEFGPGMAVLPVWKAFLVIKQSDGTLEKTSIRNNSEFVFRVKVREIIDRKFIISVKDAVGTEVIAVGASLEIKSYELLKSARNNLQDAKKEIEIKISKISDLEKKAMELDAKTSELNNKINQILKVQAEKISFDGVKFKTNKKIVLNFKLDRHGVVEVSLLDKNNQVKKKRSDYDKNPVVVFEDLMDGADYKMSARIVSIADPNSFVGDIVEKDLKTEERLPDLFLSEVRFGSDKGMLKVTFNSNQSGFCIISYYEIIDASGVNQGFVYRKGEIKRGQYGDISGDVQISDGSNSYFISDKVSPGKKYRIFIEPFNIFGVAGKKLDSVDITVEAPKLPEMLSFDNKYPLDVALTPVGATISWVPTIKPGKDSCSVRIYFPESREIGNSPAFVQIPAVYDDKQNTVTSTIALTDIGRVIAKSKSSRPVLEARMVDQETSKIISQAIKVSFSIPDVSEIEKTANGMESTTRKVLLDVSNKVLKKKPINWDDLLDIGLSIIAPRR